VKTDSSQCPTGESAGGLAEFGVRWDGEPQGARAQGSGGPQGETL
jgi:hypothetical protein